MANDNDKVKRGPGSKSRLPVSLEILTDADRERVQKQAEEKILAERKKIAEEALLEELLQAERAKFDPMEELEDVLIDMPAFATLGAMGGYMLIDGVIYVHGDVVRVTRSQAMSMREQMARSWEHEASTGNPNASSYRPVKQGAFSALSAPANAHMRGLMPPTGFSRM